MHIRRIVVGAAAVAALVASLAITSPVQAGPARPATVFGPPTEQSKVTLAETSVDGPGLWTSGSDTVKAVVGWTGTDPLHHLNVMTSADGQRYTHKATLHETSFVRPAVTRMSDAAGGNISVAWVGTDPKHTLNVLFDVYGSQKKLTLWGDDSFTSPALQMFKGNLLLVWAGTDPVHSLNVLPIAIGGRALVAGQKVTLPFYNSVARPSIDFDATHPQGTGQLILSWTGTSLAHWIRFATSADGVHWTQPANPVVGELSDAGPSMVGLAANNMPLHWLTWTGTDPARSVNVRYTETFPNWPLNDTMTTLRETALGGPMVGYVGANRQLIVAWAGTDPLHHLNVAVIGV
jgi:hypothetical protein